MADENRLDELLEGRSSEEIMGAGGLGDALTKRLMERALEGELIDPLGYEKHAPEGRNGGNSRNRRSRKRVKTANAEIDLEVPRDREGTFEPVLVPKGARRLPGFDEKVIALYARGLTTRELQEHLKEIYEVEISPSTISAVTDAVLDDVKAWQARPLEAVYPIVFLDAIHVKGRVSGHLPGPDPEGGGAGSGGLRGALGRTLPVIARKWRTNRANLTPFFDDPPELRKVMYRALQRAGRKWTRPVHDWPTALDHPALVFLGRVRV